MRPHPSAFTLLFKITVFLLPAWLLASASAQLVNTMIDDTSGDPLTGATILFEPANLWRSGNLQSPCTNCTAHPDAFRAYGGSWHEGLSYSSQVGGQAWS